MLVGRGLDTLTTRVRGTRAGTCALGRRASPPSKQPPQRAWLLKVLRLRAHLRPCDTLVLPLTSCPRRQSLRARPPFRAHPHFHSLFARTLGRRRW